jgi:hypothetical protein
LVEGFIGYLAALMAEGTEARWKLDPQSAYFRQPVLSHGMTAPGTAGPVVA